MKIKLSVLTKEDLKKLQKEISDELAAREERTRIAEDSSLESLMDTIKQIGTKRAYVHPMRNQLVWSGRGRPPSWLVELLESGYSKEDLEIKG